MAILQSPQKRSKCKFMKNKKKDAETLSGLTLWPSHCGHSWVKSFFDFILRNVIVSIKPCFDLGPNCT